MSGLDRSYLADGRRRASIAALALLCSASALGGCATPYLHDPAVETQTGAVKEAYGAIADENYFKDLRTAFATLQAEEDGARTNFLIALRDRKLIRAVKPIDMPKVPGPPAGSEPPPPPVVVDPPGSVRCGTDRDGRRQEVSGPLLVCEESIARLQKLIGPCPPGQVLTSDQRRWAENAQLRGAPPRLENVCAPRLAAANLRGWSNSMDLVIATRENLEASGFDVQEALRNFLKERDRKRAEAEDAWKKKHPEAARVAGSGKGRRRTPAAGGEPAEPEGPPQPKVDTSCKSLLAHEKPFAQSLGGDKFPDFPWQLLEGVRDACALQATAQAELDPINGTFGRSFTPFDVPGLGGLPGKPEMVRLAEQIKRQRTASADAKARAVVVQAAIKELQKQVKSRTATDWQIKKRLGDLKDALADAPAAAKLAGAEGWATLLEDMLAAELEVASSNAGAEDRSDEAVSTAPPQADSPDPAAPDPDPASTAADGGTAEAEEEEDKSLTTKRTEAVLAGLSAMERLAEAVRLNDPNQRVSALLIAIAAKRQEADMATLEQQRADALLANLEAQQTILITEVSLLAEALRFSQPVIRNPDGIVDLKGKDREYATSALNRYSLSWSEGRIPFALLEQKKTYIEREYRIRMAERTAANWKSLIQPAIAQLEAAGSGGIRPEVIAGLLGRLGIGTAILEN